MASTHTSTPSAPARASAGLTARDLALIAAFTALMVALFPVKLAVAGPTPIVLQNLALMLAGAVLGAKRGFYAALLFVLLAVVGLPVLASGVRGLAVFTSPSVGFVVAYPLVAWVIGRLVELRAPRVSTWWVIVACLVGGILVSYALGVPGMAWRSPKLTLATAATYSLQFIPGDLVKAVIAGVVAAGVHRAVPGLLPAPRPRRTPTSA
ncbi:biotin transporter BioY [Arsenicicoccus piscis]|uniref:Biotin transporter n=1 Tax=Arsenicicoccus piscis TaxID=673954 RepID=A0ABQ6HL01_9MICO|nr:biotin transporter BioY [Arsenicicoccus piscis]MCH8627756.1 biotin transporter BioY [Arsenicicoccus piscis]GMA18270.1 BioY family transporter [Arsenicicoccus piscis]